MAPKLVLRYGLGTLAALLALVLRWPLWFVAGTARPFLTFYPAIILSSWYCGLGPGIVTALLSAVFVLFAVDHGPLGQADYRTGFMFMIAGSMTAAIAYSLRATRQQTLESQEKLRLSEERSKHILESVLDGFISLDSDYQISGVNGAAEKILNTDRRKLLGQNFWGRFSELIGDESESNFRRTMTEQTSLRFEYLAKKTGRWFEIATYPSTGGGISIFFRDITGSKLDSEALRMSEERFRVALEQTPISVFNLDRNLQLTWMHNAQTAQTQGDTANFPPGVYERVAEAARQVLESESGTRFCHSARDASGLRAYDVIIEPLRDAAARIVGVTGATIDITASKRAEEALSISEERLRLANDAAHMGAWTHDLVTGKVVWSEELERVFGLLPGKFAGTEAAFREFVHPDDRERIADTVASAQSRLSDFEFEFRFTRADNEQRWMLARGHVYADESGQPCRIAGVGMDITDRRKLEEKVRHAAKLESLGVLAGGIAHDFNNLLTGILGNASLLREMVPPAGYSDLLTNVIRAAERAAQLSRQMLAYSGRGQFSIQPVDLTRQVREFVRFIETTVAKNVTIRLRTGDNLPMIEGDEGQLQQVIMNLVVNASEAIGEKEGWVEVSTRLETTSSALTSDLLPSQELPAGDYVVLQITDNGCGMDDATRAKIFDPFFTTKFTGRGLGLAAVLGIIRGHRGTVRVSSQPGIGTCFQVYFPASRKTVERSPYLLSNDTFQGTGTILVVDDEEIVRVAARTVLESFGYTVLEAENGREALRVYERHPNEINVVLLDMTMPVMSGVETLQHLRKADPSVVVVATSGYNEAEAKQIFGGAIAGFIQKPYTAPDLGRKIKLVCNEPSGRIDLQTLNLHLRR